MTTWTEALVAVTQHIVPDNRERLVPLVTAPDGWETDAAYWVRLDTPQHLATGDPMLALTDGPCYRIDKATGAVERVGWQRMVQAVVEDGATPAGTLR